MRQGALRVFGVVVVLLGIITAHRVGQWQDERTLWMGDLEIRKPRYWLNLGVAYDRAGDLVRAEGAYLHAIDLANDPVRSSDERIGGLAQAESNLALLRWRQGDQIVALTLIARAHDRIPTHPQIDGLYAWMTFAASSPR